MSTPAGWYDDPQSPGQQRYWDGTAWTEQRQPGAPAASTLTAPPAKPKHTARNILIVLAVLLVLMGGCAIALVVAGGSAVNDAVEEMDVEDAAPGGPDNPMEIKEGEAFSVREFDYQPGWSIANDGLGGATVKGFKVTNNRGDKDSALVEIKLWNGTEVLAMIDCTTSPIDPGTTVSLSCISGDKLPKSYEKITINDTF